LGELDDGDDRDDTLSLTQHSFSPIIPFFAATSSQSNLSLNNEFLKNSIGLLQSITRLKDEVANLTGEVGELKDELAVRKRTIEKCYAEIIDLKREQEERTWIDTRVPT
jgi:predicted RNase H-like nuclease (RuvC/YqgF family)